MPNQRLSKDKRALVLSALVEGTPINAVSRMFKTGKHAILRVIAETGEALAHYQRENFRDLPCQRIEMDEQWQYVHTHGQRMEMTVPGKGDYWLWCAVDPDTKLVLSYLVDRRNWNASEIFVEDVASRVRGPVQITTDNHRSYERHIRAFFGFEGVKYGTETKIFGEPDNLTEWQKRRKNGVPQVAKAKREAIFGSPDLGSCTTAHIERVFLSVRQEVTRFTRCTLAYSKSLRMHKLATSLYFGIYNLCRKHSTLGTTPAVAAGVEEKRWTLEDVVTMTDAYWQPKLAQLAAQKAFAKRLAEDKAFEIALSVL